MMYRRRLFWTIGVTVCCALLVLAASVVTIVTGHAPTFGMFNVGYVIVVVTVAARMIMPLRIGQSRITQSLTGTAIMLGLMYVAWPWLIIAVAVGVATARSIARFRPRRIAFTTAKDVVIVALAGTVGWAMGAIQPFHATISRLPALLVVAGIILVTDEALTLPVRAFANEQPIRATFVRNWHIRIASSLVQLLIAVAAGYLLHFDQRIAVATPLVLTGLQLAYANRVHQRADRLAWQQLAKIADALGDSNEDSVRRVAVTGAAELFSCDEVELELHLPDGSWLLRGDARSITYAGPAACAPPHRGMLVHAALESRGSGRDGSGRDELRLRFAAPVMFSEREHYTLRALASALGTAIRNAAAVAEVTRMATDQAHAATHDELTGLANRRHLLATGAAFASDDTVGLVVLYLNEFKQVGDALGRQIGDQVLLTVAERLAGAFPGHSVDMAARLGGAEFGVLLTQVSSPADALVRTEELLATIAAPIEIDNVRLEVRATAGVAVGGAFASGDDGSIDELLRRAEVAMYQAKEQGQSISLYVRTQDTADADRLALTADLARAVAERQFTVAFQPIVDLTTGMVVAAEALARWYHPQRGDLPPDRFLDSIERSGLLAPFTSHVLDQTLAGAVRLRAAGFAFPVAVNVSPRSLLDPAFPDSIPAALGKYHLPPEALTVELTETLTLSQLEIVDDVLHALRDMGVTLALDDFGTGFSSLATIARVPVHELKIDRTFVANLDGAAQFAIVRSTIELGRSLDLLVVAEGIESEEQRERLWSLGCAAGQGHLFAWPMDIEVFIARLQDGHDGVAGRLVEPMHTHADVIRLPSARAGGRRPATGRHAAAPAPTSRTRPDTEDSRTAMPE
jgi:diguanylate cyclase (GGDEF)-like protein